MESDAQDAVERLRAAAGADPSTPGRAWPVHDPAGELPRYFLVELGAADAVIAVGAVDDAGRVMTHARLPGTGPHFSLSADDATRAAGMPRAARTRLVWRPSRQSASRLYPLWEVSHGTKTAYVDLGGVASSRLGPGGPG